MNLHVAYDGGGIVNLGTITLNDRGSVGGNKARSSGGGVYNNGTLTLYGDSSVSGNFARGNGGGVADVLGAVTLNGASQISRNTTDGSGAGIWSQGNVHINDAGSITGNTAQGTGGGVAYLASGTFVFVCAPADGANVYGNAPDDCWPITYPPEGFGHRP